MKDYAKIVNTTPRETRSAQKAQPQEKPNLVRSAKELQPKESGSSKNTFGILLVLFILAVVGYGVVRQYFATHHIDLSSGTVTKEVTPTKKSVSTTPAQNSVPQFDFYTVLPKGTQPAAAPGASASSNNASSPEPAPTAENTTPTATPSSGNTPTANTALSTPPAETVSTPTTAAAPVSTINVGANNASGPYYLNAGDYSSNDDAQKMLSQLLLLGAQASVTTKTVNGATAYEVLVGPFSDLDTMNVVKNQLGTHQINAEAAQ